MLTWPDASLYRGVASVAEAHESEPALVTDDETTTYGDLLDSVRSLAAGLADLGIGEGDRIAVWLGNRPEWLVAQLAASALGATVVAVNTRYRRHELEYILTDADCRLLLVERSFLGTDYHEILAEIEPAVADTEPDAFSSDALPSLEAIVSLDESSYDAIRSWESVCATPDSSWAPAHDDPEKPVVVFYTSGTTGDPKGCVHGSRAVLNHSHAIGEWLDVTAADAGLTLLPFCGIMGFNYLFSVLTHGATAVFQPYFDGALAADRIAAHDVTYLTGTAEMVSRIVDAPEFTPDAAASLERGAVFFANGYDEDRFERIEDAVGFPIVQPYGLSEANTHLFMGDPDDPRAERKRVGGPLIQPDEESATVVDPDSGEELPPGERGELCLKGYNVMQEYLGKPEATAEAVTDGWFHTGDLCARDDRGYFTFHARVDDALRVRGFLVSPREIERVLDDHPTVMQSQVVGAPHPRHGEVPIAFVRADDDDLSADDLAAFLDGRIADYKQPAAFEFLDAFPRTEGPHGEKIQKQELRDRVEDRYRDA